MVKIDGEFPVINCSYYQEGLSVWCRVVVVGYIKLGKPQKV
ncbi:hypothetical protein [Rufibacter immobilis]|nr:hypothetical protein [Rufibacter immobilis]